MLKALSFSLFMLLYSPFLRSVEPSLLEEVNKCDAIFCPSGSAASAEGRTSPHPEATTNTGVKLQKIQATSMHIEPVILPTVSKVFENHLSMEDMIKNNALTSPSNPSPSIASQEVKTSTHQKTQAAEYSPSNNGFEGGAPISGLLNTSGSNPSLKHGLLYRDDDNDSGAASQNIKPLIQQNTYLNPNMNTETNNTTTSNSRTGVSKGLEGVQANQALFSGSNSTLNSPFGQFESPSGNRPDNSQNEVDGGTKLLLKIAGALGLDRFFATKGKSGSTHLNHRNNGRGGIQGSIKKEEPLKDPLTILQAQLDKHLKQERSLASRLEFGSSQSSLFHSMCEHYKRYAQRARITEPNTQPCPKP